MSAKDEFAWFFERLNVYVLQRQRQLCSGYGGAKKWCQWQERENITVKRLIDDYDDMLRANHAAYNPSDWHVSIIGTPPVFVLDDIKPEQLAQIRDELGITAVVETSPSNYQVWIRLQSDGDYLPWDEWHPIKHHLREKYHGDAGAAGERHTFRLPMPGSYSHKREHPYLMRVTFDDGAPKETAKAVLSQIPAEELQRELNRLKPKTITRKKQSHGQPVSRTELPEWFKAKWRRRREDILSAASCPTRPDGTPDMSKIDFRLALQTLRSYRSRDLETRTRARDMVFCAIEDDAEARNKPQPERYAQLTVERAVEADESEPEDARER